MNKAVGIAIALGVGTLLFCVLFLYECHEVSGKSEEVDRIRNDSISLEKEKTNLKDTISVQYRLLAERNETIGKLKERIAAGDLKAAQDLAEMQRLIEVKNQVIDQLKEDKQKELAIAATLKRGYITKQQADADLKKTGPAFGTSEADKNIAKLGQEADDYKTSLTDTKTTLGQRQEELRQSQDSETRLRTATQNAKIVIANQGIRLGRKQNELRGIKGWFRGGQKRLIKQEIEETAKTESELENALNKK